jgi:hypothetical protein
VEPTYEFPGELWESVGEAAWVFVTLPVEQAEEVNTVVPHRRGFGSVRVAARIGDTEWRTSIFPDKSLGSYVLPIKRSIRDQEQLDVGDVADVTIRIAVD